VVGFWGRFRGFWSLFEILVILGGFQGGGYLGSEFGVFLEVFGRFLRFPEILTPPLLKTDDEKVIILTQKL